MQLPSSKEVLRRVLRALFAELVFVAINVTIHTVFVPFQSFLSTAFWYDVLRMAGIGLPAAFALMFDFKWLSMIYYYGYFISHIISLYNDRLNGIVGADILHQSGMLRTYIIILGFILGMFIEICIASYNNSKKRKAAQKLREERNAALKLGAVSDASDTYGTL